MGITLGGRCHRISLASPVGAQSTPSCRVIGSAARPQLKILFQRFGFGKAPSAVFLKDIPLLISKPLMLSGTFKPHVLDRLHGAHQGAVLYDELDVQGAVRSCPVFTP